MTYPEIVGIAAAAWSQVKPAEDPELNGCTMHYRDQLIAQTEAVINTRSATTNFEKAVLAIVDEKAQQEAAATSSEAAPAARTRGVGRPTKAGRRAGH